MTEVQRVVKAVRDVRTSPSDRIVRASALIALGIGCAGAALGFALGVGSTGTATVSVFGIRLEEVPSAWVAAVAAVLAVVATLLTARGWRTIWGRGRAKEELSVQAEALRIRRSLLEARVLELEGEVAELERRREASGSGSPVVALPDLDPVEGSRTRRTSSGSARRED